MSIFYGPVLSRRFGYSLGIDLIPYKYCSYDCIYCQLGKTTNKIIERKKYIDIKVKEFLKELREILISNKKINYITFAGSGEPTLSKEIGEIIGIIKENSEIPVAVLTNSSLLNDNEVINSIKNANLIKISLDAPNEEIFKKINCPHDKIEFNRTLDGLELLLNNYRGNIFIEIMLIKGINDSLEVAVKFRKIIDRIFNGKNNLIKIHLNTPVRPAQNNNILIPDKMRLLEIKKILGEKVELINDINIENENKYRYETYIDNIIIYIKFFNF